MMAIPKPEPLCRYRYDPLDRLAGYLPLGQVDTRCFYRLNKLTTEIQGQVGTSWLQAQDQLLAQWQQNEGKNERVLIATDTPGSVIHALGIDQSQAFGYMPYGTRTPNQAPLHLPGFNGAQRDPVTGHYLLGNGYRAFNPVLMRFNSPDSLSPFGEGGLNAYAYCAGDPVSRVDPSGHGFGQILRWFFGKSETIYDARNLMSEVYPGVYAFEKNTQNKKTIFIFAHGSTRQKSGYHSLMSPKFTYSPRDISDELNLVLDIRSADEINLVSCHSASGYNPFAKQLSALLKKPVVGYEGTVSTSLIEGSFFWGLTPISPGVVKTKTSLRIDTEPDLLQRFMGIKYRPVTFRNYRRKSLPASLSLSEATARIRLFSE